MLLTEGALQAEWVSKHWTQLTQFLNAIGATVEANTEKRYLGDNWEGDHWLIPPIITHTWSSQRSTRKKHIMCHMLKMQRRQSTCTNCAHRHVHLCAVIWSNHSRAGWRRIGVGVSDSGIPLISSQTSLNLRVMDWNENFFPSVRAWGCYYEKTRKTSV